MGHDARLTVLLVDDDAAFCRAFARKTAIDEVRLLVTHDARQARSQSEAAVPDLAIVDLILEEESGLDLVRWLRARHPFIWIALVSAELHDDAIVRAMTVGADDCVAKPFTLTQLIERQHERLVDQARALPTMRTAGDALIHRALRIFDGNQTRAANALDIGRRTLIDRLREMRTDSDD